MFKLAHISDVHLGPLPNLSIRELASKRITGYVNWHRNRRKHLFGNTLERLMEELHAAGPDHVAVTGDMVNLATGIEIRMVKEWLANSLDPLSTSIVPGNHDAYVPGAHDKSVHAWYDYIRGDDDPQIWSEDHKLFPYIRRRGPLAIIGCSTSLATPPFSAMGYFSPRQAREVAALLKLAKEEGLFRVVLIHHPPIRGAAARHKRMVGIRRFGAAIRLAGAELVLHGHTHLNTHYSLLSHGHHVPVIGIASASQGPGASKPAAAFNLFSISGGPGKWDLHWERRGLTDDSAHTQVDHRQIFSL